MGDTANSKPFAPPQSDRPGDLRQVDRARSVLLELYRRCEVLRVRGCTTIPGLDRVLRDESDLAPAFTLWASVLSPVNAGEAPPL